ncbi:MAG: alanine--glyoxylate aminotransferase family protein [Bdellovibrionaceae bacterium]|nr:alanine--glyoxylate aminotransferase family protein [Pseudobdellovibrionaceae bacterium]
MLLLAPGPVNLHPEVQRILSLPMIHHRTPEFDAIFARARQGLKRVFGTQEDVFLLATTGSGGMEALLVNTLSPGDKILVVVSGKFGERWAEMGRVFGLRVVELNVPWGEAVQPGQVAALLRQEPDIRAVFCQACETSTGVLHPVRELARLTRDNPDTLLLIDGITAVGALPMPMDEWGIDGLVAGSQKAFMLPTGLSFVSLSKKAWAFAEKSTLPKYYLDLKRERKANQKGESAYSTPVPLVRALDWVLSQTLQEGLANLYRDIERRALLTREFARLAGLTLYAKSPSPSLTAFLTPAGVDSQKIREELELQHGVTIMGGQDQARGKILRIGHMGYIRDEDMLKLFDLLGHAFLKAAPADWSEDKITKINRALRLWVEAHP